MKYLKFQATFLLYTLFSMCFADTASALHFYLSRVDSFGREIECSSEYLSEELNDAAEEVRCYQRDADIFYTRNLVNRTIEDEVEADVRKGFSFIYKLGTFQKAAGVPTRNVTVSSDRNEGGTFETMTTIQLYDRNGTTIVTVYNTSRILP